MWFALVIIGAGVLLFAAVFVMALVNVRVEAEAERQTKARSVNLVDYEKAIIQIEIDRIIRESQAA